MVKKIKPQHKAFVTRQVMLIEHYDQMAAALKLDLAQFLYQTHDINTATETWHIDTNTGTLTKHDA